MTLSLLKGMKNGDCVQIHGVRTDMMDILIPMNIVQDDSGPTKNTLDKFGVHIHFKQMKNVFIDYQLNGSKQPLQSIRLNNLKQVSSQEIERNVYYSLYSSIIMPIN